MYKFLEKTFEIIGWIRIAISPIIIGTGIAAIIYFRNPTKGRLLLALLILLAGFVLGIIWATRIYKSKQGTAHFLSSASSTPELDKDINK